TYTQIDFTSRSASAEWMPSRAVPAAAPTALAIAIDMANADSAANPVHAATTGNTQGPLLRIVRMAARTRCTSVRTSLDTSGPTSPPPAWKRRRSGQGAGGDFGGLRRRGGSLGRMDLDVLGHLELVGADGATHRLGDFWADRAVVLVF